MKNLKLFLTVFTLVFALQVFAYNPDPIKPSAELRSEMVDHLGSDVPFEIAGDELTAEVLFTVNPHGEVIILSVISENSLAVKHIKNRVNYKKVSHRPSKPGEMYLMPVRVVKS